MKEPTARENAANTAAAVRIRLATPDDADGILSVYAPYVSTPVTFEVAVPESAAFRARMEDVLGFYPCLVAETDLPPAPAESASPAYNQAVPPPGSASVRSASTILGYAYAHAQAERAAYAWNAELSVYTDPSQRGKGVGSALYGALLELLRLQGMACAYARVTLPNAASERLHAAFGFELMGVQRNAGYTCGAWRDVAWLTRPLGPFEADPVPPVAFPLLVRARPRAVDDVLARANDVLRGRTHGAPRTDGAWCADVPPAQRGR